MAIPVYAYSAPINIEIILPGTGESAGLGDVTYANLAIALRPPSQDQFIWAMYPGGFDGTGSPLLFSTNNEENETATTAMPISQLSIENDMNGGDKTLTLIYTPQLENNQNGDTKFYINAYIWGTADVKSTTSARLSISIDSGVTIYVNGQETQKNGILLAPVVWTAFPS